jgi:hypothetical protein
MAATEIFEVRVLKTRETHEALYVQNPNDALRFAYIPKSEVRSDTRSAKGGLWRNIEIPSWLAEEKGFS